MAAGPRGQNPRCCGWTGAETCDQEGVRLSAFPGARSLSYTGVPKRHLCFLTVQLARPQASPVLLRAAVRARGGPSVLAPPPEGSPAGGAPRIRVDPRGCRGCASVNARGVEELPGALSLEARARPGGPARPHAGRIAACVRFLCRSRRRAFGRRDGPCPACSLLPPGLWVVPNRCAFHSEARDALGPPPWRELGTCEAPDLVRVQFCRRLPGRRERRLLALRGGRRRWEPQAPARSVQRQAVVGSALCSPGRVGHASCWAKGSRPPASPSAAAV